MKSLHDESALRQEMEADFIRASIYEANRRELIARSTISFSSGL